MTRPRVITEPLGGSPLGRAAAEGKLPAGWLAEPPRSVEEWRERARAIAAEFSGHDWLARLMPAFQARGRAAERLERVIGERGVLVTTGQQPGLFGGPIYTWSKALSALALADEIEARTGVPCAAVFWAATDDADFAEASWTALAIEGGVELLKQHEAPPAGTPMSAAPLGDVATALRALAEASGSAAFELPLEAVRAAYGDPRATVGGAYVQLLRAILEPLGMPVLDASHPRVREGGAPLLRRALERHDAVRAALAERSERIRAAGFTPQVEEVPGLTLVFATEGGEKRRISAADARAMVSSAQPASLSPNVLLRPVLERFILPTVAYVAGPGELAYFAQVSAVAAAVDAPVPVAVPRWSTTIVEPRIERLLERLGVTREELADVDRVATRLAQARMPEAVQGALAELRAALATGAARLREADREGLLPAPALDGAERQLAHRLDRLERRYLAATKRHEHTLMRSLGTARAALWPEGHRQERFLNFLPLLARHGTALLDEMRAAAREHARQLVGSPAELSTAASPTALANAMDAP